MLITDTFDLVLLMAPVFAFFFGFIHGLKLVELMN